MLNRMDDELRERHDAWIRERVRTLRLLCSMRYRIIPQEAGEVDTEELEREITTLQTKLNSAHNVNPAIIQQYENRREKVSTW